MGRFISRDPLGYVDGMGLYNGYFAARFALDPSGASLQLAYYAIQIGISAFAAYGAYSVVRGTTNFGSLLGHTDPGPLGSTTFKAGAGGESTSKEPCDSGSSTTQIYGKRWTNGLIFIAHRELVVFAHFTWAGGNISGRLDYSASGSASRAGFKVMSIVISITEKIGNCECKKFIPCIEGTVHIRDVYDQPWPRTNVDRTTPARFKMCADGTS